MSENRIGGDMSGVLYLLIFLVGVLIGSWIRVVAFIMPKRIVEYFIQRLLPKPESD